jgi:hypothetical protein
MATKTPIKLLIQDAEDLAVVAAHLQDSVVRVGDMRYLKRERRFVVLLNRFCWEDAEEGRRLGPFRRTRAGLHFDGVSAVKCRNIDTEKKDDVLELLTITFAAGKEPGGVIELVFAGDATLHLTVECIEGAVSDITRPWLTLARPCHDEALEESETNSEPKPA